MLNKQAGLWDAAARYIPSLFSRGAARSAPGMFGRMASGMKGFFTKPRAVPSPAPRSVTAPWTPPGSPPRTSPPPLPQAARPPQTGAWPVSVHPQAPKPFIPQHLTGSGNPWWGKPSEAQLLAGNRTGASRFNPFRYQRQYADDSSIARRLGQSAMFAGTVGGVGQAMMLPSQLQSAGEMGFARALDEARGKNVGQRLLNSLGMALIPDGSFSKFLARSNPNVANNYSFLRANPGKAGERDWKTIYNLLLGRSLQ